MILVAGLSPAWQRILTFDEFHPGEVNRARSVVECPSGKVINVAIALQSLGAPAKMLTTFGGRRGRLLSKTLAKEFNLDFQAVGQRRSTRFCQTLLSASSGATTEIVEECPPMEDREVREFEQFFSAFGDEVKSVVLTGSLPPNVPTTFYRRILQTLRTPAIVDAQGEVLRDTLAAEPLVIKPNRKELQNTVGRELASESQVIDAAWELHGEGARWVVVTDGPNPILAVGPGEVYRVTFPAAEKVNNPIGCGDSLAAGIAATIENQTEVDLVPALRRGVACALANLTAPRPAALDPERVEGLRSQIRVAPI